MFFGEVFELIHTSCRGHALNPFGFALWTVYTAIMTALGAMNHQGSIGRGTVLACHRNRVLVCVFEIEEVICGKGEGVEIDRQNPMAVKGVVLEEEYPWGLMGRE